MHVGVIGGGLAGLSAAYDLAKSGHRVTVLEASPQLGGLIGTFKVGGERLEQFYHHIFMSDTEVVRLIEELDLGDRLEWKDSKVGFYHGGQVYDFVTPIDLLHFTPLPLIDRVRVGLAGVRLRRLKNWQALEPLTARDWIVRNVGRRAYDVVWGPLLQGKFGARADEVGMVWFWGKIYFRFSSRKGVRQKEQLGYLMGSFGLLIDELARQIVQRGGEVRTAAPVKRVVVEDGKAKGIITEQAGEETFTPCDVVIATIDPAIFRKMVPEIGGDYLARLSQISFQAAMCLNLVLKESLSRIYWMNISAPDIPFLAVIEHTNFIDRSHYGGKHVIYLSKYLSRDDPLYSMTPSELLEIYLPHLKKINPRFERDWVEDCYLFKADAAQPIISTNYSRRIPELATPIDGLYLANMSQIYPQDRGQNYAIELGYRVSAMVKAKA